MRFSNMLMLAVYVGIFLSLISCSGGGSDGQLHSDPTAKTDLSVTKLTVDNSVSYLPGEAISVSYDLSLDGIEEESTTIEFHLLHKESLEGAGAGEELEKSYHLGTVFLDNMSSGSRTMTSDFLIPNGIDTEGEYILIAYIDPSDSVNEINESDNHPHLDNEDYPYSVLTIETHQKHNFVIKSASIHDNAVILDLPEATPEEGITENISHVTGFIDGIYHGELEATAVLRAEFWNPITGNWDLLHQWNSSTQQYEDEAAIGFAYNGDDHYFGFDIALMEEQIAALHSVYNQDAENTVKFRFALENSTPSTELDTSDNFHEVIVPYYMFDKSRMYATSLKDISITEIGKTYEKTIGDKSKFAAGVSFDGKAQLDLVLAGVAIHTKGEIDAYIFNAKNVILSIDYAASAYEDGQNTGYTTTVQMFNNKVFEEEKYEKQFKKEWKKTWEEKKTLVEQKFMIGPVPMSVKAGVEIKNGNVFTLQYAGTLTAEGKCLSMEAKAYAQGGIDLLVVKAGIEADLMIVKSGLALESSLYLGRKADFSPYIDYAIDLNASKEAISGKFGLYAETTGIKWCSSWGIPYPCGKKTQKYNLWLYQTPGLIKDKVTIYKHSGELN